MSARAAAPADFDGLALGRLTWIGLIVAVLGWALMIGEATMADVLVRGPRAPTLHGDLVTVAQCLIGSGFGLAIVGALQSGFGTLNRFFEAVLLLRSNQRAGNVATGPVAHSPAAHGPVVPGPVAPAARTRRPYRLLADGSVEVETIVGTRRFATMNEAADFI